MFILIIIYFIFLIRQDIIDNLELKRERGELKQGVAGEEERGARLRTRIKELNKENCIEELARTKLGLVKKGETAYKVISHE